MKPYSSIKIIYITKEYFLSRITNRNTWNHYTVDKQRIELFVLYRNTWNCLTVCKQRTNIR